MAQPILQKALPNPLDTSIIRIFDAAIVVIHFGRLVKQPLLEPCLMGINDGLVLRDMLFLDRGDRRTELPGDGVGKRRADGHVVIMGLMLPSHEYPNNSTPAGWRLCLRPDPAARHTGTCGRSLQAAR